MTLKDETYYQIANAVAVIINEDVDLQSYCLDKLGANMTVVDNANYASTEALPIAQITKDVSQKYINKDVESTPLKGEYPITVMFMGKFAPDDATSEIPTEYLDTINGIKTWLPADIMRRIADRVGEQIDEQIGCKVPGVMASQPTVVANEYMAEMYEDGVIESSLQITLYKRRTF